MVTRYGFLLLEHVASQDPLTVSVAFLNQFNILPEMYQVGYTKLIFRTGQITELEDTRNRTLHGILRVQSCFRGYRARSYVKEHRKCIVTLQSFVRGENTRSLYSFMRRRHQAATILQSNVRSHIVRKKYVNVREASLVIQSGTRGWLVRRCSGNVGLQNPTKKVKRIAEIEQPVQVPAKVCREIEPDEVPVKASVLSELQRRALKAEAALRENEILQQRLQQYENRWSEYEQKMRSMEEGWQKQMRSLQSSLSIAKKSLAMDDSERTSQGSADRSWDSSGNSSTPNGARSVSVLTDREMSASLNVISRLPEEFEQRSQVFADDADFLVEVKSGKEEASLNPERELRRLKQTFELWKKDYSLRLREAKIIIHKLGSDESSAEKVKQKWWGMSKMM